MGGHLRRGVIPQGYVAIINAVAVDQAWYDRNTADLVEAALTNSFVGSALVGWRPLPDSGFSIAAGYTIVALGGGATAVEVLEVFTGTPIPDRLATQYQAEVSSVLHMVSAELGYEVAVWDHLILRGAIGFRGTVAASSSITLAPAPPRAALVAPFLEDAADQLDAIYTDYVYTPVLSLYLGYRFGAE